jgi:hypothetical protein
MGSPNLRPNEPTVASGRGEQLAAVSK